MTVEESFRDTRNSQPGQGLSESTSRSAQRFEMLLMIGHLACWLLRSIGESAPRKQMTWLFPSTCRTQRKEISVITLARRTLLYILYNLQWLSILRKTLLHLPWQTPQPFLFS
jgi:hypothetical protein